VESTAARLRTKVHSCLELPFHLRILRIAAKHVGRAPRVDRSAGLQRDLGWAERIFAQLDPHDGGRGWLSQTLPDLCHHNNRDDHRYRHAAEARGDEPARALDPGA